MTHNVIPLAGPFQQAVQPRQLPWNIEAEQALLGAILINNDAFAQVALIAKPEHFHEEIHQRIFDVMGQLARAERPITFPGLISFLGDHPLSEDVSTAAYLAHLAAGATSIVGAPDYALTIRDMAVRRALIVAAQNLEAAAHDARVDVPPHVIAAESLETIQKVTETATVADTRRDAGLCATTMIERARSIMRGEKQDAGVSTGLPDLDRATGGFQPGTLWIVGGRPRMGKAQPLDAQILTPNGFVPIGSLQVGDAVSHPYNGRTTVVGLFPQGRKKVFRVTFSDGRSTRCCQEHLWEIRDRHWSGTRVVSLAQIRRRQNLSRVSIPLASAVFGLAHVAPISAYALGALIGDGSFHEKRGPYFSSADSHILERVREGLPHGAELLHSSRYDYRIRENRSVLGGMRSMFSAVGLPGSVRSVTKRVHPSLLNGDETTRLEVLRGLLDTDGTVEKDTAIRFCSVSKGLAEDVVYLARSLGGMATMRKRAPSHYTHAGERRVGKEAWSVTIRHSKRGDLLTLPRKISRFEGRHDHPGAKWLSFASIEEVGEEECMCIKVEADDGLYFTDNFIITHNTIMATGFARKVAMRGARMLEEGLRGVGSQIFSLEVTEDQIIARILADLAYTPRRPVTFGAIMRGDLDESDLWAVEEAQRRLSAIPLALDVAPNLSVQEIAARVRGEKTRMDKKGTRLAVIFVDYLKFITASDRYRGNRVYEIGEITKGLKQLAKNEDVCVVLLAQVNRAVDSRDRKDRAPGLSDLRESGDLEADADVVLFIDRESVRLKHSPEYKANNPEAIAKFLELEHKADLIIAKTRTGSEATLSIWFDAGASTFSSQARGGAA